jgi:D-lactate dehydrogenase (cytochrome)
MEGTVTGEHGVGIIKRDYLPHEVGETTVDAMRRVSTFIQCHQSTCLAKCFYFGQSGSTSSITDVMVSTKLKLAFDPLCLLNCDKVVRVDPPAAGEIKAW